MVGTVTVIFCYYLFYKLSLFLLLETQVKLKQKLRKGNFSSFFPGESQSCLVQLLQSVLQALCSTLM